MGKLSVKSPAKLCQCKRTLNLETHSRNMWLNFIKKKWIVSKFLLNKIKPKISTDNQAIYWVKDPH